MLKFLDSCSNSARDIEVFSGLFLCCCPLYSGPVILNCSNITGFLKAFFLPCVSVTQECTNLLASALTGTLGFIWMLDVVVEEKENRK